MKIKISSLFLFFYFSSIWAGCPDNITEGPNPKFLKCADKNDYGRQSWCKKIHDYPLVNHLRDAADFVDLKGGVKLLTIGMLGEGIVIKDTSSARDLKVMIN